MLKMTRTERAMSHIGYEVRACCVAARLWLEATNEGRSADVRNALLESELLHARALFEFLVKNNERPRQDDMLRTSFAPEWKPDQATTQRALRDDIPLMNKHLAHLSWTRVDDVVDDEADEDPITAAVKWEYARIANDVYALTLAWAKHVTASEGKDWQDEDITALILRSELRSAKTALDELFRELPPQPQQGAHRSSGGIATATTNSTLT